MWMAQKKKKNGVKKKPRGNERSVWQRCNKKRLTSQASETLAHSHRHTQTQRERKIAIGYVGD